MKQSELKQIYDKFLGLKCSISHYYRRIRQGIDPFVAVKQVKRSGRKKQNFSRSNKYREELNRYLNYQGPKTSKARFYGRLERGYSKEEAIKVELKIKPRKVKSLKELYVKAYTVKERQFKQDDYEIRIKYSIEESKVIKNEYERMIEEIEIEEEKTDDLIEAKELKKKLDKLQKELDIFISYNK